MKALVVGAGAVGQVFGYHLAQGGADVAFYVKPKYVDECKRGFVLYHLPHTEPLRFQAEIVTEPIACDHIYITVPSPALHTGSLDALLRQDATIVRLTPSLGDRAYCLERMPEQRLVDGSINFLSYHAPLPGETRFGEPGMAYWWFPGKSPFSGERADEVVAALRAGELPAKRVRNVETQVAFPSALLGAFVAALEAAGWSFAQMRGDTARLGAQAAAEAIRVVGHELGAKPPLAMRLAARPFTFRAITRIVPHVMPVDAELYLQAHFTKVAEQMHASLQGYVERGRTAALPVDDLERLHNLCTS